MHVVRILPSAEKALAAVARADQRRIARAIDGLATNPRPRGAVKLAGEDGLWRIRAGDYRVIYSVQDGALLVLVIRIGHRREVYRR
jgi:mRNA interferase RelE/StbE